MSRWQRIRASRITLEVASWTIGVLVMLGLTVLVLMLVHRLGWSGF